MMAEVEVKRVDSQGRLVLPSKWRESQLDKSSEVYIIKRGSYLKIVPKRRPNLKRFFDEADLSPDAIGDWDELERVHAEAVRGGGSPTRTSSFT